MIDSHIHFDQLRTTVQTQLVQQRVISYFIAVSTDWESARRTLNLSKQHAQIIPAVGWHPEQPLPTLNECADFLQWSEQNIAHFQAIGEVGLPYYTRLENPLLPIETYMEWLEQWIILAKRYDLPLNLHIVHDDVPHALDLLEKHSIVKAHFHWFKGPTNATERLLQNGYYISITPDIMYEERTQHLVKRVPLDQMMIESDAPYPLEGPFTERDNDGTFLNLTVKKMSELLHIPKGVLKEKLTQTTKKLYSLTF